MPVETPTLSVAPSTIVCRLATGNLIDAPPLAAANLILSGTGFPVATVAADDLVLIQDTDDSFNLKTVTAQSIADLASALGDVIGPAGATNNALPRFDTGTGKLIKDSPIVVTDAGAMSGMTTVDGRDVAADGIVLDTIEPGADITDEGNVLPALDGATIPGVTVAAGDLVLVQDIDDANNLAVVTAQSIADLASGGAGVGTNLLINGNYDIAQRGTTFAAPASGSYTLDRWNWGDNAGVGVVTITQDTDVPNGFSNFSLGVDVTTPDASIAVTDLYQVTQRIEGFNTIPMAMGSADAADLVLSFWVFGTVTGIHCVSFRNNGGARSYVTEYTINVTDTWEFKTVTLTGDLTGTWLKDNGLGILVDFTLAAGANFQTAANTWTAGNFVATVNQVNQMSSAANFFKLSQVKLEVGLAATTFTPRLIPDELQFCKRYFQKTFPFDITPASNTGQEGTLSYRVFAAGINAFQYEWILDVQMRDDPGANVTFFNPGAAGSNWRNFTDSLDSGAPAVATAASNASRIYISNTQIATDDADDFLALHATVESEL